MEMLVMISLIIGILGCATGSLLHIIEYSQGKRMYGDIIALVSVIYTFIVYVVFTILF